MSSANIRSGAHDTTSRSCLEPQKLRRTCTKLLGAFGLSERKLVPQKLEELAVSRAALQHTLELSNTGLEEWSLQQETFDIRKVQSV